MEDYRTVEGRARAELEEKRSRFIASLAFADTEQKALDFLAEIREANRTARHNVYAYILREGNRTRYSDDGEPPKTAGLPVLEVLTHAGLTDCVLVVTRYFGGILLGTGGLVRAYSGAASLAIKSARVVTVRSCVRVELRVEYSLYERAALLFSEAGARMEEPEFADQVTLRGILPEGDELPLLPKLTELTRGGRTLTVSQPFHTAF